MDKHKLVRMANQIGAFFSAMPDRDQALVDIAQHIRRFWAPIMRRDLMAVLDEDDGNGMDEIVREALSRHRAEIA